MEPYRPVPNKLTPYYRKEIERSRRDSSFVLSDGQASMDRAAAWCNTKGIPLNLVEDLVWLYLYLLNRYKSGFYVEKLNKLVEKKAYYRKESVSENLQWDGKGIADAFDWTNDDIEKITITYKPYRGERKPDKVFDEYVFVRFISEALFEFEKLTEATYAASRAVDAEECEDFLYGTHRKNNSVEDFDLWHKRFDAERVYWFLRQNLSEETSTLAICRVGAELMFKSGSTFIDQSTGKPRTDFEAEKVKCALAFRSWAGVANSQGKANPFELPKGAQNPFFDLI